LSQTSTKIVASKDINDSVKSLANKLASKKESEDDKDVKLFALISDILKNYKKKGCRFLYYIFIFDGLIVSAT